MCSVPPTILQPVLGARQDRGLAGSAQGEDVPCSATVHPDKPWAHPLAPCFSCPPELPREPRMGMLGAAGSLPPLAQLRMGNGAGGCRQEPGLGAQLCGLADAAGPGAQVKEQQQKENYEQLLQLDGQSLVPADAAIECPICLGIVPPGEGVTLRECLHAFCR